MPKPKRHIIPGFPPTVSPASHAVEADGWVFLTGQLGRDLRDPDAPLPDDVAVQTRIAIGNMRATLEALGMGLDDVVSVRVFLTQFERDYVAMNAAYALEFREGERPVRTCVGVTALARGALVELDCVAKRG